MQTLFWSMHQKSEVREGREARKCRSDKYPFRFRGDESRTNDATYQHTAHQLTPCRIAYRFHPFFEREVEFIRRLRAQENPTVVVQMEGLRFAIPCWMLDQSRCQSVVLEKSPRISIKALVQLRDLIDRQKGEGASTMINQHRHEASDKTPIGGADSAPADT